MLCYSSAQQWHLPALACAFSSHSACVTAVLHCAQLAKKRTAEKKLAITVFSFPPDKGNVGTAAYLNVFGSIYRVLQVSGSLCLYRHDEIHLRPCSAQSYSRDVRFLPLQAVMTWTPTCVRQPVRKADTGTCCPAGPEAAGLQRGRHPREGGGPHQERPQRPGGALSPLHPSLLHFTASTTVTL